MSTCGCGKPADTFGGLCGRCAALQILELGMNASQAEIEESYLTLVKVWHPDRFQTDLKLRQSAEEKLKEINAAHDFLTVEEGVNEPDPDAEVSEFSEQEDPSEETLPTPEPEDGEPAELKRVLKRYQKQNRRPVLPRIFFAVGGIAAVAFLLVAMDLILSSNSMTQRSWDEFKTETSRDIHSTIVRLSGGSSDDSNHSQENSAQPSPAPVESSVPAVMPKAAAKTPAASRGPAAKAVTGARPYITSGLSPTEVLAVLGNPTSSSGERLFYGGSEIDFHDGQVAGWKIDPKNPIRVKLWPDQPLTPGIQTYAVGSSKSDVIALQGTPTMFSGNEFDYGESCVYFKDGRVVGWKENPASVKLRVVTQ